MFEIPNKVVIYPLNKGIVVFSAFQQNIIDENMGNIV